jgi:hypothetical protein
MQMRFKYLYSGILAALALFIGFLAYARPELRTTLTREGGLVETLSAVGYLACLGVLFVVADKSSRSTWCAMLLLGALSLRELDFHKRFTTISVTKSKFYLSGEIPVMEKVVAIVTGLVLLGAVVYLVKRHARGFLIAIRSAEAYAIGVMLAALLLCIVKSGDGLPRKLIATGLLLSRDAAQLSRAVEESLELGVPLMLLVAIPAYATNRVSVVDAGSPSFREPAETARRAA